MKIEKPTQEFLHDWATFVHGDMPLDDQFVPAPSPAENLRIGETQMPLAASVSLPLKPMRSGLDILTAFDNSCCYSNLLFVKGAHTRSAFVEIAKLSGLTQYQQVDEIIITKIKAQEHMSFASGYTQKSIRDLKLRNGLPGFTNDYRSSDLVAIKHPPVGCVELSILRGADSFCGEPKRLTMPLHDMDDRATFLLADVNGDLVDDLVVLDRSNFCHGNLEMSVFSGASGYQELVFQQPIAMGSLPFGDDYGQFMFNPGLNRNWYPSQSGAIHANFSPLIFVKKQLTGGGTTEFHACLPTKRSDLIGEFSDERDFFGDVGPRYEVRQWATYSPLPLTDAETIFAVMGSSPWGTNVAIAVDRRGDGNQMTMKVLKADGATRWQARCDEAACECNDFAGNAPPPPIPLKGHKTALARLYGPQWFTTPSTRNLNPIEQEFVRALTETQTEEDFIKLCRRYEHATRVHQVIEATSKKLQVPGSNKFFTHPNDRFKKFWYADTVMEQRVVAPEQIYPCPVACISEFVRITSGGDRYCEWMHVYGTTAQERGDKATGPRTDEELRQWYLAVSRARQGLNIVTGTPQEFRYVHRNDFFFKQNGWRCCLYDQETFHARWTAVVESNAQMGRRDNMFVELRHALTTQAGPERLERWENYISKGGDSSLEKAGSPRQLFLSVAHAIAGRDLETGVLDSSTPAARPHPSFSGEVIDRFS